MVKNVRNHSNTLKFVYLVKLLSNREANLSPESFENAGNFEGWGVTLVAYK